MMQIRPNTMKSEERYGRTVFGLMMMLAAFVSWGKWVVFALGFIFVVSAWQGYCSTCQSKI